MDVRRTQKENDDSELSAIDLEAFQFTLATEKAIIYYTHTYRPLKSIKSIVQIH